MTTSSRIPASFVPSAGVNELSLDTLMPCINAVQRDMTRHEQLAGSEDGSDEDIEYHGQYVLDLSRALSELGSLYRDARKGHPGLPEPDQPIGGQDASSIPG